MPPTLRSTGPVTDGDAEDGNVYFDFTTNCALVALSFGTVTHDPGMAGRLPRLRNWVAATFDYLTMMSA